MDRIREIQIECDQDTLFNPTYLNQHGIHRSFEFLQGNRRDIIASLTQDSQATLP